MKFILTGGGTGGHVYPAVAIADALKSEYPKARFLYVGIRGRAEEKIVPGLGYEIRYVQGAGLAGIKLKPNALGPILKLFIGTLQAVFIHLRFRPDVVIGTGGYASVPSVLAAVLLRRLRLSKSRIFIHEQNYAPGNWNRLIARWVDRIWISFEGSKYFLRGNRVELTGYPIRGQVVPIVRDKARAELSIPSDAKVLLVFGGSQGARSINRVLIEALPDLLADPKVEVFHGSGIWQSDSYNAALDTEKRLAALNLEEHCLARYHRQDYYHDIQTYYGAADLIVCRGGAGTLSELCRCGRASLIVPKSNLAGEHQVVNALGLTRSGAAELIFEQPVMVRGNLEAVVDKADLVKTASRLLSDPERLQRMEAAALNLSSQDVMDNFINSIKSELSGERLIPQGTVACAELPDGDFEPTRVAYLSSDQIVAYAIMVTKGKRVSELERSPIIETLRYFADGYLVNRNWRVRNNGVKLVGILGHSRRRDLLLSLASDRSRAPFYKKLFGGDFKQVGFIRRNALISLGKLGIWDDRLRDLLVSVLTEDPYYEARSAAVGVILILRDKIGSCGQLARVLETNVDHRSPEVRWKSIEALGAVTDKPELLENIERFLFHPNWRIRQALILAVGYMVERGLVQPGVSLIKQVEGIIPTCTDFIPTFPLKRTLNRMHRLSLEGRTSVNGENPTDRTD
ncbi:glycosyltransferase [Gemmatimonadota bacterium]